MNVVLPDNSELELPDGATGLDAARAIGSRLAEQAVLIRADGRPQDLRDPLADGAKIQILTTRDTRRPRRARRPAPFLGASARRGGAPALPRRQGRDRPADRERLLLRLRLPGADHRRRPRADRGRGEARAEGRPRLGAPRGDCASEARERFLAEDEPYKVELVDTAEGDITLYEQGDFVDLCRGPHLQNSKPIKAFKLTSIAGAYWRGDEHNKQLTRIYGTAFYSQADLDAYLDAARGRAPPRPPPARPAARPLPLRGRLAGRRALASEGHGALERARVDAPLARTRSAATSR